MLKLSEFETRTSSPPQNRRTSPPEARKSSESGQILGQAWQNKRQEDIQNLHCLYKNPWEKEYQKRFNPFMIFK